MPRILRCLTLVVLAANSAHAIAEPTRAHEGGRLERDYPAWAARINGGFQLQDPDNAGRMFGYLAGGEVIYRGLWSLSAHLLDLNSYEEDFPEGSTVAKRDETWGGFQTQVSYLWRRTARHPAALRFGAGIGTWRRSGTETVLNLRLADPDCDLEIEDCEVLLSTTNKDLRLDWFARPIISVGMEAGYIGTEFAVVIPTSDDESGFAQLRIWIWIE